MISISAFLEHHRNHYCVGCVIIEHSCWTTNGCRDSSIIWRLNYLQTLNWSVQPFFFNTPHQLAHQQMNSHSGVDSSLLKVFYASDCSFFTFADKKVKILNPSRTIQKNCNFFYPVGCQMKGKGSSSKRKFLKVVMTTATKCKLQLTSPELEWQLCKYKQELAFFQAR